MRRLSALDAVFLYTEEIFPGVHQHTIKVTVLGPNPDPAVTYSFERAKAILAERLHRLPPFHWRIVRVPGDLHHPVAVHDSNFDLDFHVRRVAAHSPGSTRELSDIVADIASRPLDRSKPLWEMHLVEGLEGGRVAAVAKVHHTLADGVASAELLDLFCDAAPAHALDALPEPSLGSRPTAGRLVASAAGDVVSTLRRAVPRLVGRSMEVRAARRARPDHVEGSNPPRVFSAPAVSFNRALTPHRGFTVLSLPLADVKAVKSAHGVTINDVLLATTAGGLRRYLQRRGELPDRPLVGGMPVSTRPDSERLTWGNHLGRVYVSIPVDVEDCVERLGAAHRYAAEAKAEFSITTGARIENWVELLPKPLIRAVGTVYRRRLASGRPSENLVVSNVPGPRRRLSIGGAPVESFFSVGPLLEGVGINLTAWSYVDQLNVSVLTCREALPDPWQLNEDLRVAFDELVQTLV